ncbi:hypothetical protein ATANTOWER_012319 [Ataeniobius toweri]|uniref:Uncharacterized protein n=1 Tax=Ataeniobius toweri TaxID=208326 RepID=A0ABU7C9D4_9TELE|nr:hypothetical protein [Ataeniobius toweri]
MPIDACSASDVVLNCFVTSSSMCPWSKFGQPPVKVHNCSTFPQLVNDGSHCASLESPSHRNDFLILSRLTHALGICCLLHRDVLGDLKSVEFDLVCYLDSDWCFD